MAAGVEQIGVMPADMVQNMYPTFLNPDGLPPDPEPLITKLGRILPGWPTAIQEFEDLREAIKLERFPTRALPTLEQLDRITISSSGCWELPIYKDGSDVYPETSPLAGKSRARYGILRIVILEEALAHRSMFKVFRGAIAKGHFIDHLCCNKSCCYHRHLEPVSPAVNNLRARQEKRAQHGELPLFL